MSHDTTPPMRPSLHEILHGTLHRGDTPAKTRINRVRVFLDTLAEEGFRMSSRDARSLLNDRVNSIANHMRVTRPHLLRQYIDEEWVQAFARNIAQSVREEIGNDDVW